MAQQRQNEQIDAAIASGTRGRLQKSMAVTFAVGAGKRNVTLVSGDGTVSPAGRHYYAALNVPAPSIYPYEQALLNGKWLVGFDGGKHLVQRQSVAGQWQTTKKGADYFRYNKDHYQVEVPVLIAHPPHLRRVEWRIDQLVRDRYVVAPEDAEDRPSGPFNFTVGKLKAQPVRLPPLATDAEREAHVLAAVNAWVGKRQTLSARDGGVVSDWRIVLYDSPQYLVHDPSRPPRITRVRENVYDRSTATSDSLLERPLRQFFVIPEGCWRPWDLHPESFVRDGRCAVAMLHSCFMARRRKRERDEGGEPKRRYYYTYAKTEDDVEGELDVIFRDLGYSADRYPFEKDWREDGCTGKMVVEFCRRNEIVCHVYRSMVKKGNEIECHIPEKVDSHTPRVDFFVRDDHCFWYGKPLEDMGVDKTSGAANGIAQMWREPESSEDEDEFADKETLPLFKQDRVPPFSEWLPSGRLLRASPTFEAFALPAKELRNHGKQPKRLYFFTTDIEEDAARLERTMKDNCKFSMKLLYGASPDKATGIVVHAKGCRHFIVRSVPKDYEILAAIFETATEELHLDPDRVLVYKGESGSQVAERLRLEVSRVRRCRWSAKDRQVVRARQCLSCAHCGGAIEADTRNEVSFHLDHVRPLCEGGEDTLDNLQALCLTCHAQKSETERLGAVYRKPLYSDLSRDVLEGLFDAPKPKQLVFGDGHADCLEVDAIRCRTNALIKSEQRLPVANILDVLVPFNVDDTCSALDGDFFYINAGEPLDDPLEALPYLGPGWYSYQSARAVCLEGYSKTFGRISIRDLQMVFRASEHAPPDALAKPFADIERIVGKAMEGMEYRPDIDATPRPYTGEETQDYAKTLILAMQGSWTAQHQYSWRCENAKYEEDAPGRVHMWRPNDDGTRRLMCRTETLCNRTMFLIGRLALDAEHLLIWRLYRFLCLIPRPIAFHGCINDCLLISGVEADDLRHLLDTGKSPPPKRGTLESCWPQSAPGSQSELEAVSLHWPDGAPMFRVKDQPRDAPEVVFRKTYDLPKPSSWRGGAWDERQEEVEETYSTQTLGCFSAGSAFGFWSSNGRFKFPRRWWKLGEEEGLGRGADDTFQEEMAEAIVKNSGGYVCGRGGTGKSWLITRLVEKFEADGFVGWKTIKGKRVKRSRVHVCAFTHVAAGNVEGHTVLHELHRSGRKGHVVIVDEASMIPLSMWSALLNLKLTGNIIVALGDMDGQFTAIADQHLDLEGLDRSDFMHDLCNGLRVTMSKYRRGDDEGHFRFVGSIYPALGIDLHAAIDLARDRYPAAGALFFGTTLVISHRYRVRVNARVNVALAREGSVLVVAGKSEHGANLPQDMWVWEGIVLMAVCSSNEQHLKNGLRYRVVAIEDAENSTEDEPHYVFELARVGDDNEFAAGTKSFTLDEKELGSKLRLTHAVTYFSSQARTVKGRLRLSQTSNRLFTIRHLIVGLGRAPAGSAVQVE